MKIEDYNKYYIQGSDHYLIPKDVFKELFNEMINWKEEVKELKKQLENYKKLGFKHLNDKCNKLETQQKEFIKYLEDLIKFYKNRDSYMVVDIHGSYDLNNIELELLEEILQKYKSIIGDDK